MNFSPFEVSFAKHKLACDWCGESSPSPLVILHGAGNGTRERFTVFREKLLAHGAPSLALDFVGHGQTAGLLSDSSLQLRTAQARAVLESAKVHPPLRLLGSSMGAYNAIKLSELFPVECLVLLVPGIYTPAAYSVPFGPEFSRIIREPESWNATDAWSIISKFEGNLLIVAAENDVVIPREIPERLLESATSANFRELHWVAGQGLRII